MTEYLGLSSELLFRIAWITVAVIAGLGVLLMLWTGAMQWRLDAANTDRIRRYQRWEVEVPAYVFGGDVDLASLQRDAREVPELFRVFLQGCRASIQGEEYQRVVELYRKLGLRNGLDRRLNHRSPRQKALAAAETANFHVDEELPKVVPLLFDVHGYVGLSAARALSLSGDLAWAGPVMRWVLSQPYFSSERLTGLLEPFGPGLIPWMDAHLPSPKEGLDAWCIYVQLVARHRFCENPSTLLQLLQVGHTELKVGALRALAVVGDPEALSCVLPFTEMAEPVLREAAALTLPVVAGLGALEPLSRMMEDPVYEVRRAASIALEAMGERGTYVLERMKGDPDLDSFARDMAKERLESMLYGRRT